MPVLIQKFGGTSVSTSDARAAAIRHVLRAREQNYSVVVVVSAMGREPDPYATDTFLGLLKGKGKRTTRRDQDLVASCGEIIAAGVFAAELRQELPEAVMLTGWQAGIVTDNTYGNARIVQIKPARIRSLLESGHTVVVAGFQGMCPAAEDTFEVTTLGRGGSDTTAVALGVALGAAAVEIYTDVPGIMTADPRLVPEAKVIPTMDYSEVLQLAYEGAQVIHSRAVELALQSNIPLRVKCNEGSDPGTTVTSAVLSEKRRTQPVIAVANRQGLAQVALTPCQPSPDLDQAIFAALSKAGISADLINISPDYKRFAVKNEDIAPVESALVGLPARMQFRSDLAKVSIIGIGMRGVPGIMARVTRAAHAAKAPILQTSDSHMTISCLVDEADLPSIVNALHRQFDLAAL